MLLFELQSYNIFSILIVEFRLLISMILYTNMLERNKSKKIRIIYDIRNNPTRQFFSKDSIPLVALPDLMMATKDDVYVGKRTRFWKWPLSRPDKEDRSSRCPRGSLDKWPVTILVNQGSKRETGLSSLNSKSLFRCFHSPFLSISLVLSPAVTW